MECHWGIESSVRICLLGMQSATEVVKHGRLRWFGHAEHKSTTERQLAKYGGCGGDG